MRDQLKYSRQLRMFREDYISVCVYLNVESNGRRFHDVVIYRKIKTKDGFEYRRGTNLKPKDLPVVSKLLSEASDFITLEENSNISSRA